MRPGARLPLALPAAGWTAGVALARVDAVPAAWLPWVAALALGLLAAPRTRALGAWLLAGLLWGGANLLWDARLAHVDEAWLAGETRVRAEVAKVRRGPGYARLRLEDVRRLPRAMSAAPSSRNDAPGVRLAGSAWLYVHGYGHAHEEGAGGFRAGDVIEAAARWHRPSNHRNPGGFDFQAWCFDRHVALIGSARGPVRLVRRAPGWLQVARERVREALAVLPPEERGLLAALTLADRAAIPPEVERLFAATGTMHLLAISGLHVGMAAGLGFALAWWGLTRREAWIIAVPVRGASLLTGLALAAMYAALAGWPLPARRALMMLAAGVAAWWARGVAPPLNSLLAALMLILLVDAAAAGSLSLWLSFLATAAILLWRPSAPGGEAPEASDAGRMRRWLMGALGVTAAAGLTTLPLTAHVFGRLPLYGLPANLVVVPMYGLFILPLALAGAGLAALGMTGAAAPVLALAGRGAGWTLNVLGWFAGLPHAVIWTPPTPPWLGLACAAGLAWAGLWAWRGRGRAAAIVALASVFGWGLLAAREYPPARALFAAWDVGQGASSALMLPEGRVLAVDAPGRRSSRFNGGVLAAEALRALGLVHVDALAVTHAQSDHMGGAASLVARLNRLGELWLPDTPRARRHSGLRALAAQARAKGAIVRWLAQGDAPRLGRIRARVLWPPRGFAPANPNNASLVLSLALPNGERMLLPGDIEARAERGIVQADGGPGRHAVALMPHHGSATSSTPALVRAIRPRLVIAQTGRGNRYGFPRPEVARRWRKAGAAVANTANGAVLVDVSRAAPAWRYAPPVRSERRAWAARMVAALAARW